MLLGVSAVAASRMRSGVLGIALGGDQVGELGVIGGVGEMGEGRVGATFKRAKQVLLPKPRT